VVSWSDLKLCMRVRFVPPNYSKELLLKFQRLHQGSRSVDKYLKDLQVTLTKLSRILGVGQCMIIEIC